MDTFEYGYIHISNGRVIALRPAAKEMPSAVVHNATIDNVLESLASYGWERDDSSPIPQTGDVQLKIRRTVLEEPRETDVWRVAVCPIDGPGTMEENIERIRHLWEVNGWDLLQVWERGGMNFGPRMFFRKPRNTPDKTPFVDPNVAR